MDWSKCNKGKIGNLSPTLRELTNSPTKALAAQQRSLASLATVILDNCVAPDHLLAEPGGVCAVGNAACGTWVTSPGEVNTDLHNIRE